MHHLRMGLTAVHQHAYNERSEQRSHKMTTWTKDNETRNFQSNLAETGYTKNDIFGIETMDNCISAFPETYSSKRVRTVCQTLQKFETNDNLQGNASFEFAASTFNNQTRCAPFYRSGIFMRQTEKCSGCRNKICFLSLPQNVFESILLYLKPNDLRENLLCLNMDWFIKLKCDSASLWDNFSELYGICSTIILRSNTISARRSKGHIRAGYRIHSGEAVTIRAVNLEVANAGKDDGVPTSLLREASMLQLLNHQNIVKYVETELKQRPQSKSNEICIITEYFPKNLQSLITTFQDGLSISQPKQLKTVVKDILFQILSGLNYLHRQGVFHRNLKPENIFVLDTLESRLQDKGQDFQYQIKIGDLGANRLLDSSLGQYTPEDPKNRERSWREARRLFYKAPELLMRLPTYGLEIDMWSVGVIFLELVLGYPPFSGENEIAYLYSAFRLIGTPSVEDWPNISDLPSVYFTKLPSWKPLSFETIYYLSKLEDETSCEYKAIMETFKKSGREEAVRVLVQFTKNMGWKGLDLLRNMLKLPGCARISTAEALRHPFFKKINDKRNQNTELDCVKGLLNQFEWEPLLYQLEFMHRLWFKYAVQWPLNATLTLPSGERASVWEYRREIINWLFSVQNDFQLKSQTVHLAVDYMNRYCGVLYHSKKPLTYYILQLTALVCLKIADVFNERSQEYYKCNNTTEYFNAGRANSTIPMALLTNAFDQQLRCEDMLQHEKHVLTTLKFNLVSPTVRWFLDAYMQIMNMKRNSKTVQFAYFVADLTLYSQEISAYPAMLRAQVILLICVCTYCTELNSSMNGIDEGPSSLTQWPLCNQLKTGAMPPTTAIHLPQPTPLVVPYFIDVNGHRTFDTSIFSFSFKRQNLTVSSEGLRGLTDRPEEDISRSRKGITAHQGIMELEDNFSIRTSDKMTSEKEVPKNKEEVQTTTKDCYCSTCSCAVAETATILEQNLSQNFDMESHKLNDSVNAAYDFYLNSLFNTSHSSSMMKQFNSVSSTFSNFIKFKELLCRGNNAAETLQCICHVEYLINMQRRTTQQSVETNAVCQNYNGISLFNSPMPKIPIWFMQFILPECECEEIGISHNV